MVNALLQLEKNINDFVAFMLEEYSPLHVRGPKVIHDTILGSNLFSAHEIAVLDLPLLQRLRRINQVDVVSLVFPSGNHNRFEHTLGVTAIVEKMVSAIFRNLKNDKDKAIKVRESYVLKHARMAAILHDCGHGPFSHMAEQIFQYCEDFEDVKKHNPKLSGASPHETLSYLIVTSKKFKEFFKKNIAEKYGIDIDLDFVGEMIVGYTGNIDARKDPDRSQRAFIVDIINGAFDADKIDYIQRDSHFTGIKMVLDIDRLFHTIDVIEVKGKKRLSVDISGVSTLEQIVFNKMMLFSTVYHHHKVRAAECLFRSIFEELIKNNMSILNRSFRSAADFLYLTDDDIYSIAKQTELGLASVLAKDLGDRILPKRALVISAKTISGDIGDLQKIMALVEEPGKIKLIRKSISEVIMHEGGKVPMEEIWVDIPLSPKFKEGLEWPVKSLGANGGHQRLRDVFPVEDWTRAFSQNKWQGYVFTKPQNQAIVYGAAKKVFESAFGIKFNEYAKILCKME